MKIKISRKKYIFLFSVTIATLFLIIILFSTTNLLAKNPNQKITPSTNTFVPANIPNNSISSIKNISYNPQNNPGVPIRIKIPTIKINATIEHVGLTKKGAMDIPKDQKNVAWFQIGPRPGENGSSVISGHYGWKDNKPSVFDNLYKLKKGDKIYIEDINKKSITFIVREIRRYDQKDDTSTIFISSDGKAHLNLITCEGKWSKAAKSFPSRLVIFADKE